MRFVFPAVCLTLCLASFAAEAAITRTPRAPQGPWHCQTPPDAQTLVPVECGCPDNALSASEQEEYARLRQVPADRLTRYDQARIASLNREIMRPRCMPSPIPVPRPRRDPLY